LFLLIGSGAFADEEPGGLIRRSVDEALNVLRDPALRERRAERIQRIRHIADHAFDWHEMARRSLGASWPRARDSERQRFVQLFTQRIAEKYMEDIDRFRGDEKIIVAGTASVDTDSPDQRVDTILVTHSRERVPIVYYMHRTSDGWRVYDFSIEGVSLVNHYRGTFGRYLVNHSFDDLLKRLAHPDAPMK
jgi:phospholipid transport system substrate-binding protein